MARPRVLLLDEPSLGLAPKMVAQIMALIRQLRDEAGLTRERPALPAVFVDAAKP